MSQETKEIFERVMHEFGTLDETGKSFIAGYITRAEEERAKKEIEKRTA